jgi:hypothetical protein
MALRFIAFEADPVAQGRVVVASPDPICDKLGGTCIWRPYMDTLTEISRKERTLRRARLVRLVKQLPEATAVAVTRRHSSLEVCNRRFGWLLDDHHGDKRLALNCRVLAGASQELVSADPTRFFIPKFSGHRGWVGTWLDLDEVDWTAIEALVEDAYRLTAPRTLLRRIWETS